MGPDSITLDIKSPLLFGLFIPKNKQNRKGLIVLSDMIEPENQSEIAWLLRSGDRKEHRCIWDFLYNVPELSCSVLKGNGIL